MLKLRGHVDTAQRLQFSSRSTPQKVRLLRLQCCVTLTELRFESSNKTKNSLAATIPPPVFLLQSSTRSLSCIEGLAMAVAAYLLFLLSFCYAQVFEDGTSVEIPTGLSSQCAAVLNKTVSCSGLLSSIVHGHFPTEGDLNVICTTDCLISLQALREDQLGKCTASDTIVTGGLTYPPTLSLGSLIFTYNYTSLRDS